MKIKANAKINLSLHIKGKRDDGYHYIDTLMQSVSLFDTVILKKADKITLKCSNNRLSGEENLGFRAARLFFEKTKINGGAKIYIKKRIPEAAGLGGGSTDAAAVLAGLNRLYTVGLSDKNLEEMAATLGADVPFFISGGTQRSTGIGEILQVLKPFNAGYFVLAKNLSKVSTGEMYRLLDSKEQPFIDIDSSVKFAVANDLTELCKHLNNSFTAVFEDKPLEGILKEFKPLGVGLSGSGPTYFAIFESSKGAKQCVKRLKKEKITAFAVKPLEKALIFE